MISLLYEEGGYRESIKSRIQEMIEFVSIDKLQNIVKRSFSARIYYNQSIFDDEHCLTLRH